MGNEIQSSGIVIFRLMFFPFLQFGWQKTKCLESRDGVILHIGRVIQQSKCKNKIKIECGISFEDL